MTAQPESLPGRPYPLGATPEADGVNFSLFSAQAEKVELCLFDGKHERRIVLPMRSGNIHHGKIPGLTAGQRYGYRVYGPHDGHTTFCNPQKLLLDPYARATDGTARYRSPEELAWFRYDDPRDNAEHMPKSIVCAASTFDWEDDAFPDTPLHQTVIYEAHVKGLTKLAVDIEHAGTYRALADEQIIGRLKALGITAVELLPVQQHMDEYHLQSKGLSNYWGYNTSSHFAVEPRYAANPAEAADELRQAVKALHKAGIEVILDVVYNHSAEQDKQTGLLLSQRGIDNTAWYWLTPNGDYENWTGCGNVLKLTDRNISRWLTDSLRYWVEEFHIDGFRFDLAPALGRMPDFRPDAGLFHAIYQDPILSRRKMIAEPWDIGLGGYQVGHFPPPFAEWNDRFRDDMRAFWIQQSGNLGALAERLAGSSDLFKQNNRKPSSGINFITAHDGFTLHDLVSYNNKHNEANGENNQDGHHDNLSDNHGIEGETGNAAIRRSRQYTAQAILAALLLSNGTPMLLAGDEFGNSQSGNNNAYCQDNATTWLNWVGHDSFLEQYVANLIATRREIPLLNEDCWWDDNRVKWLHSDGHIMQPNDWHQPNDQALQVLMDNKWLFLINGKRSGQTFQLPAGTWICHSAPSAVCKYDETLRQVAHMGIWVFYNEDAQDERVPQP